jgi:hypothetical protein
MNSVKPSLGHPLLATVLAAAVASAAAAGSQPAAATPDNGVISEAAAPRPGTGKFVRRLVRDLRNSGLEVSLGYPRLYTPEDCAYTYRVFQNCYGNNPAAPYVIPVVEPWPEEYVDPAMKSGVARTRRGYNSTYRLDPTEAIIIFGRMPPPARYTALQTWVWTTEWLSDDSPWDQDAWTFFSKVAGPLIQYLFTTVPRNQARVESFSSVDNNINNVVMEKQSGPPWDEIRYFVITPDQSMDEAVRDALYNLGVDETEIFTEGIPESFEGDPVGPLGLDEKAVDFVTLLRYAMPEDEQAADVWRRTLPLNVLRVRRTGSDAAVPYEARMADERIAVDEVNDQELSNGLTDLVDAVIARGESLGLTLDRPPEPMAEILNDLGQFGPECRKIGMNCLGDGQDASYFLIKPKPLDTGKFYAVVSTLATETGNAIYVGLSVNDASRLNGVLNISDIELQGSAGGYADAVTEPDKFFVYFFTRDCDAIVDLTDGACTTITRGMVPLAGDDLAPGDPSLHGMFSAAVRAYVALGSERGPDPSKQLRPRVLTFSHADD